MAYGERPLQVQQDWGGIDGSATDTAGVESSRFSNRTLAYVAAGLLLLSLIIGGAREGVQARVGRDMRMPFSGNALYENTIGDPESDTEPLPLMGSYGQGN